MVSTVVDWNLAKLKVQWKFLTRRDRLQIKIFSVLAVLVHAAGWITIALAENSVTSIGGILILGGSGLVWYAAWITFFDHISPKLLGQQDLTQGSKNE